MAVLFLPLFLPAAAAICHVTLLPSRLPRLCPSRLRQWMPAAPLPRLVTPRLGSRLVHACSFNGNYPFLFDNKGIQSCSRPGFGASARGGRSCFWT